MLLTGFESTGFVVTEFVATEVCDLTVVDSGPQTDRQPVTEAVSGLVRRSTDADRVRKIRFTVPVFPGHVQPEAVWRCNLEPFVHVLVVVFGR